MRIDRLHATAFGPLSDRSLELREGMNVLHGPNEAGKSSWFAAAYAGLAGHPGPQGAEESSVFTLQHRPWRGSAWSVTLDVTLANGTRLALEQNLQDAQTVVTDLSGQTVVPVHELEGRIGRGLTTDGAFDGTRILGLNRHSARATAFIGQADILRVISDADSLREAMERVSVTDRGTVSADGVLGVLDRDRRALGDLAALKSSTDGLAHAAENSLNALRELHELAAAERRLADEEDATVERAVDARREELAERIAALHPRIEAARALSARLEAPAERTIDREELHEAITVLGAYDRLPPEPSLLRGPSAEEITAEIDRLAVSEPSTKPRTQPSSSVHGWQPEKLRAYADLIDKPEPEVDRNLVAKRFRLSMASTITPTSLADQAVSAQAVSAPVEQAPSKASPLNSLVVLVALLAVIAGLQGVVFWYVSWIAALATGVVGLALLWWLTNARSRGAAEAEAHEPVLDELGELDRAIAEQERALAAHRQAVSEVKASLTTAGLSTRPVELRTLAERLEQQSAKNADVDGPVHDGGVGDRREQLMQQLQKRQRMEAAAKTIAEARAGVVRELMDLTEELGIIEQTPGLDALGAAEATQAREALSAWIARQESARGSDQVHAEFAKRLEQLLDGHSLAELEEVSAELERQARDLQRRVAEGPLREELTTARAELGARRDAVASSIGEPAALIDRHAHSARELSGRMEQRALLDATATELRLARDRSRANFAPAIERRIRPWLPLVTEGRYTDVSVSASDLSIEVTGADGEQRRAELLSHGTTEQILLLLRVALGQVLSGDVDESAPMVLDDVTVQSDRTRTRAILDLLLQLSATHQVVLFTQEHEVVDWARERLTAERDSVVELPAL